MVTLLTLNVAIIVCWLITGVLVIRGMKEEHSHYLASYVALWIYSLLISIMHLLQMMAYVTRV